MKKIKFNEKQRIKGLNIQKKKLAFETKEMNRMHYQFLLDKYDVKHDDIVIEDGKHRCKIMGVRDVWHENFEGYLEGMVVEKNGEISKIVTKVIFKPEKLIKEKNN